MLPVRAAKANPTRLHPRGIQNPQHEVMERKGAVSPIDSIELVLDQELQGVRDALADTGKYSEAAELLGSANSWGGSPDVIERRHDWRSRVCRLFASTWQRRRSQRSVATVADYARIVSVLGYSPIDWDRFTGRGEAA